MNANTQYILKQNLTYYSQTGIEGCVWFKNLEKRQKDGQSSRLFCPRLFCPVIHSPVSLIMVITMRFPMPSKVSYARTKLQQDFLLIFLPYTSPQSGTSANTSAWLWNQEKKKTEMCIKLCWFHLITAQCGLVCYPFPSDGRLQTGKMKLSEGNLPNTVFLVSS